uniref:F-box domain-containing protein n=1 Tax=Leersia perrieri TaxID=77586 RepID=A0A0D9V7Y7_9ORYZ
MEVDLPSKRGRVMAPENTVSRDFLSVLPKGIIHHIMSFLDVCQVVWMCVLSQRWRNLWRFVPCVNANFNEFNTSSSIVDNLTEDELVFRRFINWLLEHRDPDAAIYTFYLEYCIFEEENNEDNSEDANRWISLALQKRCRILKVSNEEYCNLQLDHSVLTSKYLTRVVFDNVSLDQGFFEQLEMGCPAMQVLTLYGCVIGDIKISSKSLKILNFNECQFEDKSYISIPSVTSLTMYQPEGFVPIINDVASLVIASADLNKCDASDMRHLLWSLSGVKKLEFDYQGYKMKIENNLQFWLKFDHLVDLTLGQWCVDSDFYALVIFLQSSPRLEKLTLKLEILPPNYKIPYDEHIKVQKESGEHIIGELKERSFTCEHLNSVEIISMEQDEYLANRVVGLFVDSGVTSVRFDIKFWWSQVTFWMPSFHQELHD